MASATISRSRARSRSSVRLGHAHGHLQAQPFRLCAGLLAGAHAELAQDRRHVVVDGPVREAQLRGNLGIAQPGRQQPQYLRLPLVRPAGFAAVAGRGPRRTLCSPSERSPRATTAAAGRAPSPCSMSSAWRSAAGSPRRYRPRTGAVVIAWGDHSILTRHRPAAADEPDHAGQHPTGRPRTTPGTPPGPPRPRRPPAHPGMPAVPAPAAAGILTPERQQRLHRPGGSPRASQSPPGSAGCAVIHQRYRARPTADGHAPLVARPGPLQPSFTRAGR